MIVKRGWSGQESLALAFSFYFVVILSVSYRNRKSDIEAPLLSVHL